jgi:hypothetical protein
MGQKQAVQQTLVIGQDSWKKDHKPGQEFTIPTIEFSKHTNKFKIRNEEYFGGRMDLTSVFLRNENQKYFLFPIYYFSDLKYGNFLKMFNFFKINLSSKPTVFIIIHDEKSVPGDLVKQINVEDFFFNSYQILTCLEENKEETIKNGIKWLESQIE